MGDLSAAEAVPLLDQAAEISVAAADAPGGEARGVYIPELNRFVLAESQPAALGLGDDVILVGHSQLDGIAAALQWLVAGGGGAGSVRHSTIPGAMLEWIWRNAAAANLDARAALAEGGTEVLVIAGRTPPEDAAEPGEAHAHALLWHELAAASNAGARTYLAESWPELDPGPDGGGAGPAGGDPAGADWRARLERDLPGWAEIAAAVNAGRSEGSPAMRVIPTGRALARLQDAIGLGTVPDAEGIDAFFHDPVHLDAAGAYFLALVHYAVIFDRDPRDAPLPAADGAAPSAKLARRLQAIAWETVAAEAGDTPGARAAEPAVEPAAPATAAPRPEGEASAAAPAPRPEPATGAAFAADYFALPGPVASLAEIDFDAAPTATGAVAALDYANEAGGLWEGGPTDHAAARYSATLTVREAGTYAFHLTSDDGSALYVDGARVIDNDGNHGPTEASAEIALEAGVHPLEVRFFENFLEFTLRLEWAGPDTGGDRMILAGPPIERPAGLAWLRSWAPSLGSLSGAADEAGSGPIRAEYHALPAAVASLGAIDFAAPPAATGRVAALDAAPSAGALWEGGPTDRFAARFTAALRVMNAGAYAFFLTSDDGAVLALDGKTVIDHDGIHPATELRAERHLEPGLYPLEVLFFDDSGDFALTLEWAGPDTGGKRMVVREPALETRAEGWWSMLTKPFEGR